MTVRNKFADKCYMCRFEVPVGAGHFEKVNDRWATIHADCVFVLREAKDKCAQMQAAKQQAAKQQASEGEKHD